MLFSQIIPPSPSPRVQKSILYICVSFAVSYIGSSLNVNYFQSKKADLILRACWAGFAEIVDFSVLTRRICISI